MENVNMMYDGVSLFIAGDVSGDSEKVASITTSVPHADQIKGVSPQDYPQETPHKYQRTHSEVVTVKGVPVNKLYLPVVSESEVMNQDIVEHIIKGFQDLYGNRLICVKRKTASNQDVYTDVATEVVISTKDTLKEKATA